MKTTIYISDHFSYHEATHSMYAERDGVSNVPDIETLEVIKKTAVKMEKVRALLKTPIRVDSWYRSWLVNTTIKGSKTSQHMKGEAVDFVSCPFGSPLDIVKLISANVDLINYDQLILEHTWVHISFAILTGKPRNQVLSLLANKDYAKGITDKYGKPI